MCFYACEIWPLVLREASTLWRPRANREEYIGHISVCYTYLYLKRSEQNYPITDLDRPLGLQDVEAPRICR